MHNDANLPSSILKKYQIVFDYPKNEMIIAEPNSIKLQGISVPANVHPKTGIVQIAATIDDDTLSFSLDIGASYSFVSEENILKYSVNHPNCPKVLGTLGHANMWGWWPANEQTFPVVRVSDIILSNVHLKDIGLVGVLKFSPNGPTFGEWYSQKTVRPVNGLLGPNALKAFCVGIDYISSLVYFEKRVEFDQKEMDMVGLSLKQLPDGNYQIVGIVHAKEISSDIGIKQGDIILSIDDFKTQGATMGTVVDALRGKPGDKHILRIDRNGSHFEVELKVEHYL